MMGPVACAAVGDPTEGALVVAAAQFDLLKAELENALPGLPKFPSPITPCYKNITQNCILPRYS